MRYETGGVAMDRCRLPDIHDRPIARRLRGMAERCLSGRAVHIDDLLAYAETEFPGSRSYRNDWVLRTYLSRPAAA